MAERLEDAVRAAREKQAPLTRAERAASWAAIESRVGRSRRFVYAIAASFGVAACAVWLFVPITPPRPSCVEQAGRLIDASSCAEVTQTTIDTDAVQLAPKTTLERTAKNHVRVVRGRAHFDVTKRASVAERLEVRVSDGTIIVVGTAFAVTQAEAGGSVTLEHGSVRFVWNDGQEELMTPGETLVWPRRVPLEVPVEVQPEAPPAPVEPPAPPAPPRDVRPLEPDRTVEDVMQRQFQLRGQRRYDDAMTVLRDASRDRHFTLQQRERFDYEAGNLLYAQGSDACAHWREHQKKFPASVRDDVRKALAACKQ